MLTLIDKMRRMLRGVLFMTKRKLSQRDVTVKGAAEKAQRFPVQRSARR